LIDFDSVFIHDHAAVVTDYHVEQEKDFGALVVRKPDQPWPLSKK